MQPGISIAQKAMLFVSGDVSPVLASEAKLVDAVIDNGTSCDALFEREAFEANLATAALGRTLLSAASIPSTQTVMMDNRSELPIGTACIADVQTGGKGRGGNTWESPEGCLMASFSLATTIPGQQLPFVQYIVCLAVVAAVQEAFAVRLGGGASAEQFPIRIKWPNDVYASADPHAVKIGGILCHSLTQAGTHNVVVGLGLNVDNAEPTTAVNALLTAAARERGHTCEGARITRGELLARILNHTEGFMAVLEQKGFRALEGTYRRYWLHEQQRLVLHEEAGDVPITVTGFSENGYLTGRSDEGDTFELHPDGNSLDMMQGLVRRKLPGL